MKSKEEITQAHDILVELILEETELRIEPKGKEVLQCAIDALCWCLNHKDNTRFAKNLAGVKKAFENANYSMVKLNRKEQIDESNK